MRRVHEQPLTQHDVQLVLVDKPRHRWSTQSCTLVSSDGWDDWRIGNLQQWSVPRDVEGFEPHKPEADSSKSSFQSE